MKVFNNCIYTQIRIDSKLRQFVRLVCAAEGISNRRELCEKSLEHFINSDQKMLIAPAKKGILFRVELPIDQKDSLEKVLEEKDANISRIFHTAIYSYVEHFKSKLPKSSQLILNKVYS